MFDVHKRYELYFTSYIIYVLGIYKYFHLICLLNRYNLYVQKFKIVMMGNSVVLNNLQERNNLLQSKLIHDQLKYGTYHFGHFKKCLPVITEYKKLKSFYNVSSTLKISQYDMIDWFVQGQMGNTKFRRFYLAINGINRGLVAVDENDMILEEGIVSEGIVNEGKDYIISQ